MGTIAQKGTYHGIRYADLQSKGVRCWFASEDMKIGDCLRPRIDETIRLYDKLLLVLSKTSVASQWVEQEVETALARERQQGTTVLFPVRIDDTVMTLETGWPALIRNTRNIGDFRRWKMHNVYQKAFDRLLRGPVGRSYGEDGILPLRIASTPVEEGDNERQKLPRARAGRLFPADGPAETRCHSAY
jgi:TIR domain